MSAVLESSWSIASIFEDVKEDGWHHRFLDGTIILSESDQIDVTVPAKAWQFRIETWGFSAG